MITRNKIARLKELNEENTKAVEFASELLKTAQDRFDEKVHKFKRNGQKVQVPESALWSEIWQLAEQATDAHEILGKAHPEVFEAFNKQKDVAKELKAFTVLELGIDHTKMTISDYIQVVEGTVFMMVKELKDELKEELLVEMRMTMKTDGGDGGTGDVGGIGTKS